MITLTTEQAQQIEEAFMKIADLRNLGKIQPEVIAFETLYVIRAARAQEQAEQEPVDKSQGHFEQPNWSHVGQAFIDGARESKMNPDASGEDFIRAADGYTKRLFEQLDPESERLLRDNSYAAPVQQAEREPTSKAKALDYAILTLHSIACLTQGDNLLWWQKPARNALAKIDELLAALELLLDDYIRLTQSERLESGSGDISREEVLEVCEPARNAAAAIARVKGSLPSPTSKMAKPPLQETAPT